LFRIIITVDVNLSDSIENSRILAPSLHARFEPRKNQLQPIALLNLMHKLINGEVASNRGQEPFDSGFLAVDIKETTNNLWGANGVDALNIDLDKLRKSILVEIKNEVVHEVEAIANNDKWELIREFGLLEEILDFLGVVEVALPTDALHFTDLASPGSSLDVFEVNLGILAEVDNRTKIVIEAYQTRCLQLGYDDDLKPKDTYPRNS
jgi:hypothetical protein